MGLMQTGYGPSGSGSFSPTDVAGLYAWWKADAISQGDGTAVAQWDDSSGGGRHLVQATGTAQPTFQTAELNGLPGVQFDGTGDFMPVAIAADVSRTIFVVLRASAATGGRRALTIAANATLRISSVSGFDWFSNQAAAAVELGGTATSATLISLKVVSAASMVGYRAGAEISAFDPNDGVTTGTSLTVGANTGGSFFFPGFIFEVLVYDSALSDTDRAAVESYLTSKYAL